MKINREVQKMYAADVVNTLKEKGYSFEVREVPKNNGTIEVHVTEVMNGPGVSISVSVEPIMIDCAKEHGFIEASYGAEFIVRVLKGRTASHINTDIRWEKVRDRIIFSLVNSDKNASLLSQIPNRRYVGDLTITYKILYDVPGQIGTAQVRTDMLDRWGVDEEELYQRALENTPRLLPVEILSMDDVILQAFDAQAAGFIRQSAMAGEEERQLAETIVAQERARIAAEASAIPMYVLRNQSGVLGSSALLYPGMIETLMAKMGDSFYMIPSSIHEWIMVPKEAEKLYSEEEFESFIYDVNRTALEEKEYLSDSLFMVCEGRVMVANCKRKGIV